MIKLVRVDHRLLHGQVAFSWTSVLGIDCILLVSDTLLDDPIRVTSIKLAKPTGVKIVMKNLADSIKAIKSGVTDKYKLFIVCETIDIAAKLVKEIGIKNLNIGGTKPDENKKELGPAVFIDDKEKDTLKSLINDGVYIYLQMVPEKNEIDCSKLL